MITSYFFPEGVTLRCIQDTRFKQGILTVQFVQPMTAKKAAFNALIPAVLLRGCEGTEDLRKITLKLDDLYGAAIGVLVRRIGDYQTTGLSCSFLDDRFALPGDAVFAPMVAFVEKLLFSPVTENGVFCKDYVQSEKKNLISTIQSQLNNKRAYASQGLYRHMCREDSFGVPRLGSEEDVAAITPESAYAHYQNLLKTSPVELFYIGAADADTVAQSLKPMFEKLPRQVTALPEQTAFHSCGGGVFSETMAITQGKLAMGYATQITLRDSRFAAMQVANMILGGGMTSKLFMNIREKESLCYDISSSYSGAKGILTVQAGIDCDKMDAVQQKVQDQLSLMAAGDITSQELQSAKQSLDASLEAVHDSPGSMESYYGVGVLSGLDRTPEQYRKEVAAVTAEDVAAAAKTLVLDTVFCLKGETE